ncbi:MAG: DUF3426 domain-containing protein [Candidatus Binatus sp.]|uniref:zinc-ribbon domain-containing protein n=1 Tax=Candidatus Binatus sp. TaxID=2811406 RepID=UPI002726D6AD|nr:zinc-ribbon domain-containing protein [Candidatus Binatus sp.]MDO8433173.1 DUF3426 domain-containing protein [Candidatus Binatus sp.]
MTEIQCTSCHTRYRIDERVLPDDTPTFKCSRCGHVFNADPIPAVKKSAAGASDAERPARAPRPGRSRLNAPVSPEKQVSQPESAPAAAPRRQSRELDKQEPPAPVEDPAADDLGKATFGDPPTHDLDEHPLDRSFGDHDKADTGENLKFDFSREDRRIEPSAADLDDHTEPEADQWQIGEATPEFDARRDDRVKEIVARPDRSNNLAPSPQFVSSKFGDRTAIPSTIEYSSDEAAEIVARPHSSGFFLAMYLAVAIVFLVASYVISGDPVASARLLSQAPKIGEYFTSPVLPAMLVSLHDVQSDYHALKGGNHALVITGTARNVGKRPLHLVQIDADLLDGVGDAERAVAHQTVFAGNELSAEMLGQMTPREIEFSQSLSPQKSFAMPPTAGVPFLMVFINPPEPVGALRLSVTKAVAAESPISAAATR